MSNKKMELVKLDDKGQVIVESKEVLRERMKYALQTVEKKLEKLRGPQGRPYKTNMNFKFSETCTAENVINLNGVLDIQYLIKTLSKVIEFKKSYYDAAQLLNLPATPLCNFLGFNIEHWIEDIMFRIKLLTNAAQITDLEKAKKELETFLSEEDRLSVTLQNVSKLLN